MSAASRWLPLESNPEVMNKFVGGMGMKDSYVYTDVFGFDPELLAFVPRPCIAVLLLFPTSKAHADHRDEERARLEAEGYEADKDVFYMKQTIGNACGTIGLLHSLGNNLDKIELTEGALKDYFSKTESCTTPEEIGSQLEASDAITVAHDESAHEGQTEAPALEDAVNLHFICFVEKKGALYELDGTKDFPINHGATTPDTLLEDSIKVVKEFMARDPEEMRFTVVALSKK